MMFHTDRLVLVEGKYDKIRLSAVVDALIVTTEGFGIFKDREKQKFIREFARDHGLLIVTDSDAAGFRIRGFLNSIVGDADVLNVYIPDVFGKEPRKDRPGAEGKVGVEGMKSEALEEALRNSGFFEEESEAPADPVTAADLVELGLSGTRDAAEKRRAFLSFLGLPTRLTGASFLKTINVLFNRAQLTRKWREFTVDTAEEDGYNEEG